MASEKGREWLLSRPCSGKKQRWSGQCPNQYVRSTWLLPLPPRAFSQKRKEVPLPARRGDIALFVESHHMVELSHKLTMKNDEIFFAVE